MKLRKILNIARIVCCVCIILVGIGCFADSGSWCSTVFTVLLFMHLVMIAIDFGLKKRTDKKQKD